ncbi:MAG: hypothetical protein IKC49_00755 [Clostridia bacterium]|nr:hypothetical protein [Clostridia bacterium]
MNLKKFEFQHRDIPFLKKDIAYRFIFAILFLGAGAWQFTTMILSLLNNTLSNTMIASSVFVLTISLLMFFCSMLYSFKDFRIISTIKREGRCVSTVQVMFNLQKRSFIKLYLFINFIISLLTALVLIASVTYSILEISHYSTISYYLPILVVLCIASFNSTFHVKNEIKTIETVQQFHAIY